MCPLILGAITTATPAAALAGDAVEVVVTEHARAHEEQTTRPSGTAAPPSSADATTRTVQVIERGPELAHTTWLALSVGAVTMPLSQRGPLAARDQVGSDRLRACVDAGDERYCSSLRGVDARLQIFSSQGPRHYPRVIGYVRSGYEAGEARFEPARSTGPRRGEATAVAYHSVPVFAGVSVFAFEHFPVRPYVGIGMGMDVLQLRVTRHEHASLLDLSSRFGFELHGGVEARIGNWVAFTAELQQQWSVRRRLPGVPDFANSRLAIVTGVAVAVPYATWTRRDARAHHVTTSTRTVVPPSPPPSHLRVGPPTTAPVFEPPPAKPRTILVEPPASATPPEPAPP